MKLMEKYLKINEISFEEETITEALDDEFYNAIEDVLKSWKSDDWEVDGNQPSKNEKMSAIRTALSNLAKSYRDFSKYAR